MTRSASRVGLSIIFMLLSIFLYGHTFDKGNTYVMYAYEEKGDGETTPYEEVRLASESGDETRQWGFATSNPKEENHNDLSEEIRYPVWIVTTIGIATLVLVIVLIWRWSKTNR